MKKFYLMGILTTAACLFLSGLSFAETEQRWTVTSNISYVNPTDDDADDNIYYGGGLSYDVLPYFAIGLESGFAKWNEEYDGVDYGDISAIPLLADFVIKKPFDLEIGTFVPYGIVGTGVMFWNYDESSLLEDNGISVETDTEFALKTGLGIDYYFVENFGVFLEGSYIWNDTTLHAEAAGDVLEADFKGDMWMIGSGIKYRF